MNGIGKAINYKKVIPNTILYSNIGSLVVLPPVTGPPKGLIVCWNWLDM